MRIHWHITTIGEPETYRLIGWIGAHLDRDETLTVIEDGITPESRLALELTLSPFERAQLVSADGIGMSEHLNARLQQVPTGEWAFFFGADEWVAEDFFKTARKVVKQAQASSQNAISIARVNMLYALKVTPCAFPDRLTYEHRQAYPDFQTRFVRSGCGCYYENRVHEHLTGTVNLRVEKQDSLHLLHHKRTASYASTVRRYARWMVRPEYEKWDAGIADEVYVHNCYEVDASLAGGIVIDVGAHIGAFSMLALDYGAALVIACEANPMNFARLQVNLRSYPTAQVRTIAGAVWRSDIECPAIPFVRFDPENSDSNTGGGGVALSGADPVPCRSLDSILEEVGVPVAFLKLDVEGSEFPILYTSQRLRQCRRLALEYHDGTPLGVKGKLSNHVALEEHLTGLGFKVRTKPTASGLGLVFAELRP